MSDDNLCGSCAVDAAAVGGASELSGFGGDRTSLQRPLCMLPLHRRAARLNDLSAVMNTLANRSETVAAYKRDMLHQAPEKTGLLRGNTTLIPTRCAM